jgi:hypothetical protein
MIGYASKHITRSQKRRQMLDISNQNKHFFITSENRNNYGKLVIFPSCEC